jgi:hypothetical protein
VVLRASALSDEHALARHFTVAGLVWVAPTRRIELWSRREIDHALHLRHHRDLVVSLREVGAFALSTDLR